MTVTIENTVIDRYTTETLHTERSRVDGDDAKKQSTDANIIKQRETTWDFI